MKPIKVGIIGRGHFSTAQHMPNCRDLESVELWHCCDLSEDGTKRPSNSVPKRLPPTIRKCSGRRGSRSGDPCCAARITYLFHRRDGKSEKACAVRKADDDGDGRIVPRYQGRAGERRKTVRRLQPTVQPSDS